MGAKREILPLKLGMENCGRGARGSAGLASWCGSVITAEAWMLAALASAAIAARGALRVQAVEVATALALD